MSQILFVGLDVDDSAFHGCAFFKDTGEILEFKTRPHVDGLSKKLKELQGKFPQYEIRCCYEATYIGFTLQRDLARYYFHCDVISPGSIPRTYGNQVKTELCQWDSYRRSRLASIQRIYPPRDRRGSDPYPVASQTQRKALQSRN